MGIIITLAMKSFSRKRWFVFSKAGNYLRVWCCPGWRRRLKATAFSVFSPRRFFIAVFPGVTLATWGLDRVFLRGGRLLETEALSLSFQMRRPAQT